jgi:hypothetical protein
MADTKIKGVADIVILLDVSGSMQECIDAVKNSATSFINVLSNRDANNEAPVKDWRIKVCGYRDHQHNPANWFVDNPFVRDTASVLAQLNAEAMKASGGGDEPESLLDALYKIAKMEASGPQDGEDAQKWRPEGAAARSVIFFTDATFKQPMTIPEAAGGGVSDVITQIGQSRIIVCGFCPEWDGYLELGSLPKAQLDFTTTVAATPALAGLGKPGDEGRAAMFASVQALQQMASRKNEFTKIMEQLAKTVSKASAAAVEAC